jgi:hypothetical protein
MEALEETMKKHNIDIDSSSSSSSSRHALSASSFSFNSTSTSSDDEWLIDYGASYHIANDKAIFFALNECKTKKIFVGDDIHINVVGYKTIQVYNSHFSMMYNVFQVFPPTFYQYIRSLIQVKVKSYSFHLTKL